jgi:DNA-binding NtrC family response regulator
VDKKKFRLDLLHRLNTFTIHIPPLRERPEDIEPLLHFFISDFSKKINKPVPVIEESVIPALRSYEFPGNVRELKNMVERAVILSKGGLLGLNDFPVKQKQRGSEMSVFPSGTLEEIEMALIRNTLHLHGYNQISTARALGISRDALIRKMAKYHIVIQKHDNPI